MRSVKFKNVPASLMSEFTTQKSHFDENGSLITVIARVLCSTYYHAT
jgi:hypothetical protein